MKFLALFAGAALLASPALANSFTNGSFETLTNGPGQLGFNTDATGWSVPSGGYTFAFAPGTADSTGSTGQYGGLALWGPNNGSANGLPATSPDGGNFLAIDGDFQIQPVQQVITGLHVGKTYFVGFVYAFAQQAGFDGDTIQHISSSLGGTTFTTTDFNLPNHGFSGWFSTSYATVATATTETLSFLAYGNLPVPPFALLDGVTFTPDTVPEPATWALFIGGFGLIGVAARRRVTVID